MTSLNPTSAYWAGVLVSEEAKGGVMQFFKPLSTLAVGIAVGYFLLPKVLK